MTGIAFAVAVAFVALLSWDAFRRWLAHGRRVDSKRLEAVDDMAREFATLKRDQENLRLAMGMRTK